MYQKCFSFLQSRRKICTNTHKTSALQTESRAAIIANRVTDFMTFEMFLLSFLALDGEPSEKRLGVSLGGQPGIWKVPVSPGSQLPWASRGFYFIESTVKSVTPSVACEFIKAGVVWAGMNGVLVIGVSSGGLWWDVASPKCAARTTCSRKPRPPRSQHGGPQCRTCSSASGG